jgi:2'-5' RNA ligase
VLFLGAVVTGDLLALHARVHQALADQPVTRSPYYLPGQWTPHCTLAQDLTGGQLAAAIQLLRHYQPITARISSAGVFDTSSGAIQPLTG